MTSRQSCSNCKFWMTETDKLPCAECKPTKWVQGTICKHCHSNIFDTACYVYKGERYCSIDCIHDEIDSEVTKEELEENK